MLHLKRILHLRDGGCGEVNGCLWKETPETHGSRRVQYNMKVLIADNVRHFISVILFYLFNKGWKMNKNRFRNSVVFQKKKKTTTNKSNFLCLLKLMHKNNTCFKGCISTWTRSFSSTQKKTPQKLVAFWKLYKCYFPQNLSEKLFMKTFAELLFFNL